MASVRSIDSALGITLTSQGRTLRNLIQGADTVMSHILHFYHLAAADFVDISPLGGPWNPAFGTTTTVKLAPLTTENTSNSGFTHQLVESYVAALNIRKLAHSMSARFSGRHPIQNAIVPGGVTTLFTASDVADFRTDLTAIRTFINGYYIPDVVFVASQNNIGGDDWTTYWNVGREPGNLLSYGEYPLAGAEAPFDSFTEADEAKMLLARGASIGIGGTPSWNIAKIKERTEFSYYDDSCDNLHPSVGLTTPDVSKVGVAPDYSWLKAPRYDGNAMEVGPLARMVVSYLLDTGAKDAPDTGLAVFTVPSRYTITDLVGNALNALHKGVTDLYSPLGRHACRALECKFVADAMDDWLTDLSASQTAGSDPDYLDSVNTGSGYVTYTIPKETKSGAGLAEAPRGALGHWITISNKKIASYQCVVPSTWNAGPRGASDGDTGPAESAVTGTTVGTGNDAILNVARMIHPYDFCIACAVHLVSPDGKEIAKFKMDVDGKIKKL
jgi:hydrogenase large subunit